MNYEIEIEFKNQEFYHRKMNLMVSERIKDLGILCRSIIGHYSAPQ